MSRSGFLRQKFSSFSSKHTSLLEAAKTRLQEVRANRPPSLFTEPLLEFIPRITPRWQAPLHLAVYIKILECAVGSGLRVVVAAPPQHGKTESTMHAFAWWLKKWPELRYAYATYSGDRAMRVSRRAKDVATRADVSLSIGNLAQWVTPKGGQVLWTSVGGGLTGEAIDGVMVIDDPLKDRATAESVTTREAHKDWYHGTVESRLHPGASLIVMATRWHADDLSGYLVREQGYEYINLKAIADGDRPEGDNRQPGEALWEEKRPLSMLLERQRANEWNFASLYQGEPKPRGSSLFKEPHYWTTLPERGFRVSYGVDLSYTGRTRADWSVCVELWVVPPPPQRGVVPKPSEFRWYVTDVQRKQVEAPNYTLTLKAKQSEHKGSRFYFYGSGTELGAAQFIIQKGVALVVLNPHGRDKFSRALQTSELWNLGCILVPEDSELYPWVDVFVDEIVHFSGVNDPADDQVDALVSGVDGSLLFTDDRGVIGSGGRYS